MAWSELNRSHSLFANGDAQLTNTITIALSKCPVRKHWEANFLIDSYLIFASVSVKDCLQIV